MNILFRKQWLKYSILVSIILIYILNYCFGHLLRFDSTHLLEKISLYVIWLFAILWIPGLLLSKLKSFDFSNLMFFFIGVVLLLLFKYWFWLGAILSVMIIVIPIGILFKIKQDLGNSVMNKVYPAILIAFTLAFFFTKEMAWLYAIAIFFAWTVFSNGNLKLYRQLTVAIRNSRFSKEMLHFEPAVFFALMAISLLLPLHFFVGSVEQIDSIYKGTIKSGLPVLGLLIALQGLLGNKGILNTTVIGRKFETEFIIKCIKSFKGIILFVIILIASSMVGILLGNDIDKEVLVGGGFLSVVSFDLSQVLIILSEFNWIFFLSTIALQIYFIFLLFFSGSLLIIPLKSILKHSPVSILKLDYYPDTISEKVKKITNSLEQTDNLNGAVISDLTVSIQEDKELFILCNFYTDFPDKEEIVEITVAAFRALKSYTNNTITIKFYSNLNTLGNEKVFMLDLNKDQIDYLLNHSDESIEDKMRKLNVFFLPRVFEEEHLI